MSKRKNFKNNYRFIDSALLNDATYYDYLERFKKVALSVFEWVNLPKSMDAKYIERCLFYDGQCALLKDKKYGFINTRCCSNGQINIYGLPTSLNGYSYEYQSSRKLYTGLLEGLTPAQKELREYFECILVQNDWERQPTVSTLELFALRLYEAEQTAVINVKAQKTPVLLLIDEKQRATMENLYSKYEGNMPVIFGDKNSLEENVIRSIKTEAPFIADKIIDYKKEIWNEALTFLRN